MQRFIVLSALKCTPHNNNQIIRLLQCAPIHTSSICAYSGPNEKDKQQQKQEAVPDDQNKQKQVAQQQTDNQQTGDDNQQREEARRQWEEAHGQQQYYEHFQRNGNWKEYMQWWYILFFSSVGVARILQELTINRLFPFHDGLVREDRDELAKIKKQPAISYEEFVRKYGNKVQKIHFYPADNKAVAIVGDDVKAGKIVNRHRIAIQDAICIALEPPTTEQPSFSSMVKNVFCFFALMRRTERVLDKRFNSFPIHLQFDDPRTYIQYMQIVTLAVLLPVMLLNMRVLRRRFFPKPRCAVENLNRPIVAVHGPPGNGKTAIGSPLATAQEATTWGHSAKSNQ